MNTVSGDYFASNHGALEPNRFEQVKPVRGGTVEVHHSFFAWCTFLMMLTAFLTLEDITGEPQMRLDLPLMRLGDRLLLSAVLHRQKGGRTEELHVEGEFRVTSLILDARGRVKQLIRVAAIGVAPTWKAIKNPPSRFPLKRLKVPAKD